MRHAKYDGHTVTRISDTAKTRSGGTVWSSANDGAGSGLAADTAEKLRTARAINGVSFDGSADVDLGVVRDNTIVWAAVFGEIS